MTTLYYSQDAQDRFLNERVFNNYKNGVFVDVGAHDGININNTYFFEKNLGWTGVAIEPIKRIYNRLRNNRSCVCINLAVSDVEGEQDFYLNTGYCEMISGLVQSYDARHKQRLNRESTDFKSETETVKVEVWRLDNILKKCKIDHVHYLSIDVEGAEFNVIKSIDFDKVFIDVIDFENNYMDTSKGIIEYLKTKGYVLLKTPNDITGYTDVFMIHTSSEFYVQNVKNLCM